MIDRPVGFIPRLRLLIVSVECGKTTPNDERDEIGSGMRCTSQ